MMTVNQNQTQSLSLQPTNSCLKTRTSINWYDLAKRYASQVMFTSSTCISRSWHGFELYVLLFIDASADEAHYRLDAVEKITRLRQFKVMPRNKPNFEIIRHIYSVTMKSLSFWYEAKPIWKINDSFSNSYRFKCLVIRAKIYSRFLFLTIKRMKPCFAQHCQADGVLV